MSEQVGMGLFGHVPTPVDIHAKAFALPRAAQPEGMWPGYVMGLRDAGAVGDEEANRLLIAALNGQFAHNVEPMFYGEHGYYVDDSEDDE